MTDAASVNAETGADFFDRVRHRLSLAVPAALNDPTAPAVRGDLDLDPETWTKGRRCCDDGLRRCWCPSSIVRTRP